MGSAVSCASTGPVGPASPHMTVPAPMQTSATGGTWPVAFSVPLAVPGREELRDRGNWSNWRELETPLSLVCQYCCFIFLFEGQ